MIKQHRLTPLSAGDIVLLLVLDGRPGLRDLQQWRGRVVR